MTAADRPDDPARLLEEVGRERRRQDGLWGIQGHDAPDWLVILGAELGEVHEALLQARRTRSAEWWGHYRANLVQVAAVALAAAESYDRGDDGPLRASRAP